MESSCTGIQNGVRKNRNILTKKSIHYTSVAGYKPLKGDE